MYRVKVTTFSHDQFVSLICCHSDLLMGHTASSQERMRWRLLCPLPPELMQLWPLAV